MSRTPATRAARRPSALAVVAVVVPLVTLGAALLTDTRVDEGPAGRGPEQVALTSSTLVCPTGQGGGVLVASDAGASAEAAADAASGRVSVVVGKEEREVELVPGAATRLDDAGEVSGSGALAPGLVAQRYGGAGLRAVDCPATSSDQWFTGVGAGAEHRSVLELHNPDEGPASATITVLGQSGPVGAGGELRGVSVAGGATTRIELGSAIPKREELALRVTTDRGRLAVTVIDSFVPVGRGETTKEYLAGQSSPATSQLLLGLPEDVEEPAVVVANTSDSASRVALRLVTEESTFAPTGLEEVLVDPQSVRRFSLSRLLGSDVAEGVLGVEVVSSQPSTASFRGRVGGDLLTVVPQGPVSAATLVPVPVEGARLVLGGAEALGTVAVVALDERGREVDERVVEVGPDQAVEVAVPEGATLLRVEPRGTSVQGVLQLRSQAGAAVVGLRELVRVGLVPDVRPGLVQPGQSGSSAE